MSYTIVDRRGQELKSGDYVLIATSRSGSGKMRVARVMGIVEKTYRYDSSAITWVEIRSMCTTTAYWGKYKGKTRMIQGVIDRTIIGPYNRNTGKYDAPIGPQKVECVRIDDPTLFMTDQEIALAKAKGLIKNTSTLSQMNERRVTKWSVTTPDKMKSKTEELLAKAISEFENKWRQEGKDRDHYHVVITG